MGTVFHEVMETWNKTGVRPDHLVGEVRSAEAGGTKYLITIDKEMLEYAADCRRWIEPLVPHILGVEWRVDFSDLTPVPNQRGTADLVAWKAGTLYIRDWKYGLGVKVFAEENTQLMLYAWGAFGALPPGQKVRRVNVGIAQPRLGHFDEWEVSVGRLRDFAFSVRLGASAAWSADAPRNPSPKACQWCKVRATCGALAEQTQALVTSSFSDEPTDPRTLDTAALAKALRWRKTIENWLSDAHEELLRRVEAGEDGHGFKVVQGRGRRAWRNPAVAERVLRRLGLTEDDVVTRKLLSPNQAEHALKAHGIGGTEQRNLLAVLTHKPEGKPTLVEDKDPRPSLQAPADGVFEGGEPDL